MRYVTLLILLAALAWSGCFQQVSKNMSTTGVLVIYTSNAYIYSVKDSLYIQGSAFIVFPGQSSITITGAGNYWKIAVNRTKYYSANAVYNFVNWVVITNATANLDIFCFNNTTSSPPHSVVFQNSATPTTSARLTETPNKEGGVLEKMLMFIIIMSVSAIMILVVVIAQRKRGRIGEIDEIGI